MNRDRFLKHSAGKNTGRRLAVIVAAVAIATVSCSILAFASRGGNPSPGVYVPAVNNQPELASAAATAQSERPNELIRIVRVFIHPEEMYPGAFVVKPGKIRLEVENETLSDVSLVVERVIPGQAHERAAALRIVNHGKRNRQELALGAGEYVFYEESRPQQQGRIIVDQQAR